MLQFPTFPKELSAYERALLDNQRVLFEPVTIQIDGKKRRLSRIGAYYYGLANEAAKGDISAITEQRYLIKKLVKLGDRGRFVPQPRRHPIAEEIERNRIQSDFSNKIYSVMYLRMMPDFIRQYEMHYGKNQDYNRVKPYWLDYQPTLNRFNVIIAKRKRKEKRGKDYDVGKGKPPRDCQWPKGRSANPTGRPRHDAYETLLKCWSEKVKVQTAGGKQLFITKYALSVMQMISKAQEGKPAARRAVRSTIKDLEERGLFCPPEPRRRLPSGAERTSMGKTLHIVSTPRMKRELLELFANEFGPVPDFTTDAELKCEEYLADETFASVHRERLANASRHRGRSAKERVEDDIEDYEANVGVPENEYSLDLHDEDEGRSLSQDVQTY